MILPCFGQAFPGLNFVRAGSDRPGFFDDAHFDLAGMPFPAQLIPAGFVFATELGDLPVRGLEREVRSVVGEVEEERLLGFARFIDELQAKAGPEVGAVPVFGQPGVFAVDLLTIQKEQGAGGVRLVEATGGRIQTAVKSAVPGGGPVLQADVPFSGHGGEISGGLERFGNGGALGIEPAFITGHAAVFHHVADPGLMRINARQQRGAGGATAAGIVELGETQTVFGKGIEMRRRNLRTVAANVGEAHVIHQNHDDIGRHRDRSGGTGRLLGPPGYHRGGKGDKKSEEVREDRGSLMAVLDVVGRRRWLGGIRIRQAAPVVGAFDPVCDRPAEFGEGGLMFRSGGPGGIVDLMGIGMEIVEFLLRHARLA